MTNQNAPKQPKSPGDVGNKGINVTEESEVYESPLISILRVGLSEQRIFKPGESKERHLENELETGKGAIISDRRVENNVSETVWEITQSTQAIPVGSSSSRPNNMGSRLGGGRIETEG